MNSNNEPAHAINNEAKMEEKQNFGKMVINYLKKYYLIALNASIAEN